MNSKDVNWVPVKGYEDKYHVNQYGDVKNIQANKRLTLYDGHSVIYQEAL